VKPVSNLFGNFFSGLMKKINSPEPVVIEEQTASNTQNTTFTNLSLTASSNQITEFNSDSFSPGETEINKQIIKKSVYVQPPTRPKKIFPKKILKKPVKAPKTLPTPNLPIPSIPNEIPTPQMKPPKTQIPENLPPQVSNFSTAIPKPVKKKFIKKKNKFKGNRFVAFDINKL
jgi:hypothetical protein